MGLHISPPKEKFLKVLTNKHTSVIEKDINLSYFDILKLAVENPGQSGLTIKDMRSRIRVLDILESKDVADIEDADFETLKFCWNQMSWRICSKDIIAIDDYLNSL